VLDIPSYQVDDQFKLVSPKVCYLTSFIDSGEYYAEEEKNHFLFYADLLSLEMYLTDTIS